MLTTPDRPDDAVVAGIEAVLGAARVPAGRVSHVLHGTTLFTNAIIERKGARTALVTTKGFRDAVEIAREHRYDMYDLYMQRPRPIAPRHLRFEVDERMLVDGTVRRPVDPGEVRRLADRLRSAGIEAVGVRLLHAYANPAHERLVGTIRGRRSRRSRSRCRASWSRRSGSTSARRRRSPTCTSTPGPALPGRLGDRLREVASAEDSSSCNPTAGSARPRRGPVPRPPDRVGPRGRRARRRTLRRAPRPQGPPVVRHGRHHREGVRHRGRRAARSPEFEIDRRYHFKKGSGLPIKVPVIEMIEIGTGGGSIARVDALRRLLVGPESAGAPRARWPMASAARSRP